MAEIETLRGLFRSLRIDDSNPFEPDHC